MSRAFTLLYGAVALLGIAAVQQNPRQEQLRKKLKDTNLAGTWIYDDINAGTRLAKKTKKPLLVVFR